MTGTVYAEDVLQMMVMRTRRMADAAPIVAVVLMSFDVMLGVVAGCKKKYSRPDQV